MTSKPTSETIEFVAQTRKPVGADSAAARLMKNLEVKRKKFLGPIQTPSGAWINVYATTRKGYVLIIPLDDDGFESKFNFLAKISRLIPEMQRRLGC